MKRKVKENTNDKFAKLYNIVEAKEASYNSPKRRRGVRRPDPASVVEQAEEMITQGLQRIRQAEEM
jgi:hypothetical protein